MDLFYDKHFVQLPYIDMKFTAMIEQGENGWLVGQIKEVPAALSQGKTVEELKLNLLDALSLIIDTNKAIKLELSCILLLINFC